MSIWGSIKRFGETGLGLATGLVKGAVVGGDKVNQTPVDPNAYQYGGSPEATDLWRQELAQRDALAGGRLSLDARLSDEARGRQSALYDQYGALARGEGPSLAREQMRAGLDQSQQQASQQAASARGGAGNQLLAQRYAQQTGAQLASSAAAQGAQLRAQEQLAALQAQAGLAGQMRQGDLSARGLSEQRYAGSLDARMGMEGQQLQAQMARDAANRGDSIAVQMANQQAAEIARKRQAGLVQAIAETGAKAYGGQ